MSAAAFNLSREIVWQPDQGLVSFGSTRLLLFDADALGLLRQRLLELLGWEAARRFFLAFGYVNGYADLMALRASERFPRDVDLIAAGPTLHSWEGIVHAQADDLRYDRATGTFWMAGTWANSWEAQQHLSYNELAAEPVCWTLEGYASGYATAFFGRPLVALEPMCAGKGDDHCRFAIQAPELWGDAAAAHAAAFADLASAHR